MCLCYIVLVPTPHSSHQPAARSHILHAQHAGKHWYATKLRYTGAHTHRHWRRFAAVNNTDRSRSSRLRSPRLESTERPLSMCVRSATGRGGCFSPHSNTHTHTAMQRGKQTRVSKFSTPNTVNNVPFNIEHRSSSGRAVGRLGREFSADIGRALPLCR